MNLKTLVVRPWGDAQGEGGRSLAYMVSRSETGCWDGCLAHLAGIALGKSLYTGGEEEASGKGIYYRCQSSGTTLG
jgi:hypothetical protein